MKQQQEYMHRVFHPVGQGAFFTESFFCNNERKELEKINIVYDCGTGKKFYRTSQPINSYPLYEYIKTVFDENEPIKAVFISHLDSDHCNHLPVLLNYCKVEHLFLPLLIDDNEKLYCFFKETNKYKNKIDNTFTKELIIDSNSAIKKACKEKPDKMPRIHFIRQSTENDSDKEFYDLQIDSLPDNLPVQFKPRLRLIPQNNLNNNSIFINWCFIPYNFKHSKRYQFFINYLENDARTSRYIVNHKADLNMIQKDIEANADILRDFNNIYNACKNAIGNINENSMVLYSGVITESSWQVCMLGEEKCKQNANCRKKCLYPLQCQNQFLPTVKKEVGKPGCLYLGDFNANCIKQSFWDSYFFKDIKKYTVIYQQPHHGALKNFNKSLLTSDSPQYTFFNYGVTNGPYAHPRTCSTIKANSKTTYHVTRYQIYKSIIWQPINSNKCCLLQNNCKCIICNVSAL